MKSPEPEITTILKKWRKEHNLKQTEIAKAIGISNTYVSHVENELFNFRVSDTSFVRILDAYGLPDELKQKVIEKFQKARWQKRENRAVSRTQSQLLASNLKNEIKQIAKKYKVRYVEISRKLNMSQFLLYNILSKPSYGEKNLIKVLQVKKALEKIIQEKRERQHRFAEAVFILRRKGYTVSKIAQIAGCSVSSVKRYLAGITTPSIAVLHKIEKEVKGKQNEYNKEDLLKELRRTLGLTRRQVIRLMQPAPFSVSTLERQEKNPRKYSKTENFKKLISFYEKIAVDNKIALNLIEQIKKIYLNASRN